MKKKDKSNAIKGAGRGKDGTFAIIEMETGEQLIPSEASMQLKQGNINSNYSGEEEK